MSALRFDQVVLQGTAHRRIDEVSFDVAEGECVFLIGPNGAGKSTLLRLALGIERPDAGRVCLGATPTGALSPRERAAKVAWLPQQLVFDQGLYGFEVVSTARYRFHESRMVAEEKARHWLKEVGAGHLADRRITELSGGELQRVKLGALLAQEAPLLLLDEPANHLDPAHQLEVYRLLGRQWRQGLGILCVTHDINWVSHVGAADALRVLGVRAGRLHFDTRFSDPALRQKLEELYGVPFGELSSSGQNSASQRWFAPAGLVREGPE